MNLLKVSAIVLIVVTGVASEICNDRIIVHLPANTNAETCFMNNIDEILPTSTNCVVFEDTERDFSLEIGNRKIFAHTNAIAAAIPYFRNQNDELQLKIDRLKEQHLDSSAVELLMRFVYTRQIKIDDENVYHVLTAAKFLQMENIIAACIDLLIKRVFQ